MKRNGGLAFLLVLAFVFVWTFHACHATTRGDEATIPTPVVDNQSEIPPGTQPGPLVAPSTPMIPTPADKDAEPKPDDLTKKPAIIATIAGEVIGTEVVEVEPGQLLELEPQGAADEVLVRWNYSSFIRYKTTRDRGHYVAASFTAEDAGRVILVGAVWNGESNGFAAGPMRWVVVSGRAPQPPPVVVTPSDPSTPPVVHPADPSAITAVVYVYEKDDGTTPPGVLSGLNRLNRERKIPATNVDDDVTNGDGEVPEQYKIPIAETRAKSPADKLKPALVVMRGGKADVWHDVTTELDVMEAAK